MNCWLCENQGACEVHDPEMFERKTMKLRILNSDPAGHWLSVHKHDCADLRKRNAFGLDDLHYPWIEDHETLTEAAESIACDFIGEGSMTVDEALDAIHFYPCVTLPLSKG